MMDRPGWFDEAARRVFTLNGRPDLRALPELFLDPCPRSIWVSLEDVGTTQSYELHAVGIYEAAASKGAEVQLAIGRTARPVVLFLMSYHRVVWDIRMAEGATLGGICLSSYERSAVRCGADLPFVVPIENGPHEHRFEAHDSDDLGADKLLAKLRALTHLDLTSFQGDYYGDRFTVPFYEDVTPIRQVLARHRELLAERTTGAPAPFFWVANNFIVRQGTRDQPIPVPRGAKAVAFCEVDGRFYVNTDHDLYAVDASGACEQIVPVGERFSWLGGVAYDTKRQRLVVTSFWHAGVHHLYDPVRRTWSTVDIGRTGGGIHAIVYDAGRDTMVAVGLAPLACRLIALSPELDEVRVIETGTALPLPDGLRPQVRIQMAAVPDAVLVCCGEREIVADTDSPPEVAFMVRLDRDEQLRVDLDALPRYDPVATDFTSGLVLDGYEGSVTMADLRRDARTIVEQVHRTEVPLLVNHPRGKLTMIASYEVYHGQLASLDETTHADWRDRLARATREIEERRFVPHAEVVRFAHLPDVLWTEQAADDLRKLGEDGHSLRHILRARSQLLSLPMDGPFHGWFATQILQARVISRQEGGMIFVGYVRSGPRATWGRLGPTESDSSALKIP